MSIRVEDAHRRRPFFWLLLHTGLLLPFSDITYYSLKRFLAVILLLQDSIAQFQRVNNAETEPFNFISDNSLSMDSSRFALSHRQRYALRRTGYASENNLNTSSGVSCTRDW